jgi:hypothetical protein
VRLQNGTKRNSKSNLNLLNISYSSFPAIRETKQRKRENYWVMVIMLPSYEMRHFNIGTQLMEIRNQS